MPEIPQWARPIIAPHETTARAASRGYPTVCTTASGEHVLDRGARSGDGSDRRGGSIALVRRRPDCAVGRGGRGGGGDAEFCRSDVREAGAGSAAGREVGA